MDSWEEEPDFRLVALSLQLVALSLQRSLKPSTIDQGWRWFLVFHTANLFLYMK
jgi:hypothetical protein